MTVDGSTVTIERVTDTGYEKVEGSTPAVISVVEKINDPRYPSFKGIMAAKSKPIEVKSLADIGLDAGEVGLANAWTAGRVVRERPAARGRSDRQGRGRRRREDRRLPRLQEAHLSRRQTRRHDMAEVLVLVDSVDGTVKKPTLELLTAARQLGEPSAVVVGAPGTAGR